MTMASLKEPSTLSYPKIFLSITALLGGLAVFLILASSFLVSQPIGSAVRGYFYGIDHSGKLNFAYRINETVSDLHNDIGVVKNTSTSGSSVSRSDETIADSSKSEDSTSVGAAKQDGNINIIDRNSASVSQIEKAIPKSGRKKVDVSSSAVSSKVTESVHHMNPPQSASTNNSIIQMGLNNTAFVSPQNMTLEAVPSSSPLLSNTSGAASVTAGCDLYHGKWVYDSTGPLYKNHSCPVLTQMQNCQGNGRPDKDYENWQWKPNQCDLPRFDAKRFLELMRGKTLAFLGDSVARNQMESMLCILWQFEVPKNRGNRRMQRYYFKSTNTMIIRIWSSWLVHQTSEPYDFVPGSVVKLHLDVPDENFVEFIPTFDVVVLSSGHWFAKQSVYILNNEIVGGQLWWPDKSRPMKINNVEAFGVSVETVLTSMVTHPNYTGLTIVRSYSPDHYEGGAWNTGGSCTGKVMPALDGELVPNGFTNIMHEKQVMGFNHAVKKQTNKSKLRLMDITEVFSYRHDGHPGPYRSPDPNKITKRGPDGRPPPQDCLHWCMPGPVDTWNEMVLEIIRRETGT